MGNFEPETKPSQATAQLHLHATPYDISDNCLLSHCPGTTNTALQTRTGLVDPHPIQLMPLLNPLPRPVPLINLELVFLRNGNVVGARIAQDANPFAVWNARQVRVNDGRGGVDPLRPLGVIVPEHGGAVRTEGALGRGCFRGVVGGVERERGLVFPSRQLEMRRVRVRVRRYCIGGGDGGRRRGECR